MMSSMGSTRGNTRGGRDKQSGKSSSQTSSKTGAGDTPIGKKATPDQIRIAQMISDGSSNSKPDKLVEKIKQVYDVTHKSEDEIMVALYDCQEDTERAINLLLERRDGDQGEWETISSKKKVKSASSSSRGSNSLDGPSSTKEGRGDKEGGGREKGGRDRESRDRDKDRDGNYRGGRSGRGARAQLPPRMAKGRGRDSDSASRDRDRNDQNNKWDGGETGRGRGRKAYDQTNGPSRRGRGQKSYTNSKFGTFEENDAFKPGDNVWTNPPDTTTDNNTWDGSAAANDSWTAEDWSGDLTESKVFTPSSIQPTTNSINSAEPSPVPPEPSPLPTNTTLPPSMPMAMSSMSSSSMPSSIGPSVGQSMAVQSSLGQQQQQQQQPLMPMQQSGVMSGMQPSRDVMNNYNMDSNAAPENFTRIDLSALFGKPTQHNPGVTSQLNVGPSNYADPLSNKRIDLSALFGKPTQHNPGVTSQLNVGPLSNLADPLSSQRQTSSVFNQYTDIKSHPPMSTSDNKVNSIAMQPGQGVPGQEPITIQQVQQRAQQQTSKPTKKRMPPPSTKIPLSAVEMPVSARGIGVLDVQFGAMDLSMEPTVDFGVPNMLSGIPPSSTSLQGSVAMPSTSQLPTSMASYSMGDSVAVTSPSHISSYPGSKVQTDNYPASTMNTSLLAGSTASTPIPTSMTLEQRPCYGQVSQKQMAPEPIPLPNQSQVGGFMNVQKTSPTQQLDSKSDKMQSSSYSPNMPLQLQSLSNHPTSLANSGMSQSPSGSSMHTQMGMSSHASQPLRQTPNSYHISSTPTTMHSPASLASSGISHSGYGSSHSTNVHPGTGLGSNNLAGSNLTSPLGSSGLSTSSLGPTASSVNSGHPASSLSGHSTSGLSSNNMLQSGPSMITGLPHATQQALGLAGSVSGLSNSGHMTGLQTTMSNSMAAQSGVQSAQLNPSSKLTSSLDNRMNSVQHTVDHTHAMSGTLSGHSLPSSSATNMSNLTTTAANSSLNYNSISGISSGMTSVTSVGSTGMKSSLTSNKGPPNLPPGMHLFNHQYIMGPNLLPINPFAAATHQPFYNYDDLQLQLSRMPIGYSYDPQQFPQPTNTLPGRDGTSHSTVPYSVNDQSKFTRGDSASPVASSLASQQQQTGQAGHHQTQQANQQAAFLNAATVPPGYGYGGLPYYPNPGLMPPGLSYQPAVFPATVQQNNRSQAGTTPHSAFQQTPYGQHGSHGAYGTGYDDLNQSQDFPKGGYSSLSQTGPKATGAAVSVTSASAVPGDMSASSYTNKAHSQSYADKQGFHTGTPPPFNFPLAGGNQGGPLQPASAYAHAPFISVLPQNTMLPHQLHSDGQGASSQRSQGSNSQGKPVSKPPYGGSTNWGAY